MEAVPTASSEWNASGLTKRRRQLRSCSCVSRRLSQCLVLRHSGALPPELFAASRALPRLRGPSPRHTDSALCARMREVRFFIKFLKTSSPPRERLPSHADVVANGASRAWHEATGNGP
jgi:hypothetical protein